MLKIRAAHYVRKSGDTYGPIELVVESGLPVTVTTGTTCKASARNAAGYKVLDNVTAAVAAVTLAEDGSFGATLRLSSISTLTATEGRYWIEFTLTHADASVQTIPPGGQLTLEVVDTYRLNSAPPA